MRDLPRADHVGSLLRPEALRRAHAAKHLSETEREAEEIAILERFLPPRMSSNQTALVVEDIIRELGATKLKDAGRVIAALKERYSGQMDFATAKRLLCERLH